MEMAALASTALRVVGSITGGEAEGSALNQQADQLRAGASSARLQGGAREEMIRRNNARRLAEQRATIAQSGFDPAGSAKIQGQSAGNAELDALTARYESELQAVGMMNQANALNAQAKSARRSGYLNAFGSLMESAGNYFGRPRIGPPAPVESRTPTPVKPPFNL